MPDEIDVHSQTHEDLAAAAWDGGYSFLGRPLLHWSRQRERVAQKMGMKCPGFTAEDIECLSRGTPYPGQLDDVAIFLWLCTIRTEDDIPLAERKENPGLWTLERAHAAPAKALKAAVEYAERNAFCTYKPGDAGGANWAEAVTVFWAVFNGVEASKFAIETEGGPAGEDLREKKV